jgi:drug/metabolite transporter, DME family
MPTHLTIMRRGELRGYALVVLSAGLFSTLGVLARLIYQVEGDPLTVVTFRASVAAGLLFLGLLAFHPELLKISLRDLPFFAVSGFFGVACNYSCFLYAVKYTTIATAVTMLYTYPMLVAIASAIIFREAFTRQKLISLVVTFSGVLLVVQCYDLHFLKLNVTGIFCGLGTSLALTCYTLLGKKATARYDAWTVVFYSIGFGALFLIIFRTPQVVWQVNYPARTWFWIMLLALLPTALAYASYTSSFHYIEASKASIVASAEVALAPLLAYACLQERITASQICGAGLIFGGIVLLKEKDRGTPL